MCAELATIRDYKVGQESRSIGVVNGGPLGTNFIVIQNHAAAKCRPLLWRSALVVPQNVHDIAALQASQTRDAKMSWDRLGGDGPIGERIGRVSGIRQRKKNVQSSRNTRK